jgi:hypothetical protein
MNRLRRTLTDLADAIEGPQSTEVAIILFVAAVIAFVALFLTSGQTSRILSTVSGSV